MVISSHTGGTGSLTRTRSRQHKRKMKQIKYLMIWALMENQELDMLEAMHTWHIRSSQRSRNGIILTQDIMSRYEPPREMITGRQCNITIPWNQNYTYLIQMVCTITGLCMNHLPTHIPQGAMKKKHIDPSL